MSTKLPPQTLDASSSSPAAGADFAAARRRVIVLMAIAIVVVDVAVAAWLAFGPVDAPQETRWLMAGMVLLGAAGGLFVLRRVWQRQQGA